METTLNGAQFRQKNGVARLVKHVTALAENGTVESGFIPVNDLSLIAGTVFADQAGTLTLEFSNDGVNVDYQQVIAVSAADIDSSAFEHKVRFATAMRVKYVNGSTAQTVFRLYVNGGALT